MNQDPISPFHSFYLEDAHSAAPLSFHRLMALDTATDACTVAICDGKDLIVENTHATRQTHSRHLMSVIQSSLNLAGLEFSDLDGFVVTRGPGSFTGLRIGISTVKGLAMALGKPLVGVSYLDCLALQSGLSNRLVCAVIDARRSEFYYALYHCGDFGIQSVVPESVGPIEPLLDFINEPCLFIGNGIYPNLKMLREKLGPKALFAPDFQTILKAHTLVDLGRRQMEKDQKNHLRSLVPNYIRKSDAQVHHFNRLKNQVVNNGIAPSGH